MIEVKLHFIAQLVYFVATTMHAAKTRFLTLTYWHAS